MSRKTVRIELPDGRPDDLIILGKKLTDKHTELGASSPLDETRMTKLAAALGIADQNNDAAKAADGAAQKARQVRDTALGMASGQNAQTKDTVLYLVTKSRDELLLAHEDNEEALTEYGFTVVVGTAKAPTRKPKP